MNRLKEVLKAVDKKVNEVQPKTMDEFLTVAHAVPGMENYGSHFSIVKYKGYLQGIRMYVTGRSKSHLLPAKGKVYSIFQGLEKYESAGWTIENEQD